MYYTQIGNYITGQEKLVKELVRICADIILKGNNHNLLLVGNSGTGKTHIAKVLSNAFGVRNCIRYFPDKFVSIEKNTRIHIIDEIHLLKNPEILYTDIDTGKYSFIFSTNEYGELKNPLKNRCFLLPIEEYTMDNLAEIANDLLIIEGFPLINFEILKSIASVSRDNPRRCKEIVKRLSLIFRERGLPNNINELDYLLLELNIGKGGMTLWDNKYLEFLTKSGKASINTISLTTGMDEKFIREYVEPFLIKRNLIQITSRGRIICSH